LGDRVTIVVVQKIVQTIAVLAFVAFV